MKRTLTTLMLAFGLGSLFIATPVSAQYNSAVADVPFAFTFAGHTLEAGRYNISQISGTARVFLLRGSTGGLMESFNLLDKGNPNQSSVTFRHTDSGWALIKVTPPNSLVAYMVQSERKEKNTHMGMATLVSIKLK
jgi:hypothetical protein